MRSVSSRGCTCSFTRSQSFPVARPFVPLLVVDVRVDGAEGERVSGVVHTRLLEHLDESVPAEHRQAVLAAERRADLGRAARLDAEPSADAVRRRDP
jgi:hypothetical protein